MQSRSDMTTEQQQRAEALKSAYDTGGFTNPYEQTVLAEYIFSGRILVDTETEEVRDGDGNTIFTDTTVTDVGMNLICRILGHHWVFTVIALPRQDYCKRCGVRRPEDFYRDEAERVWDQ